METIIEPPGSIIYSVLSSTKPSTYKDRKKWNLQKNLKIPLGGTHLGFVIWIIIATFATR